MTTCFRNECQTTAGCAHRGPRGEFCYFAGDFGPRTEPIYPAASPVVCSMSKFTREDFERRAASLAKSIDGLGGVDGAANRIAARAMDREKMAQALYEHGHPGGAWLSWQEIQAISKENWLMIADALIAMLTEEKP